MMRAAPESRLSSYAVVREYAHHPPPHFKGYLVLRLGQGGPARFFIWEFLPAGLLHPAPGGVGEFDSHDRHVNLLGH